MFIMKTVSCKQEYGRSLGKLVYEPEYCLNYERQSFQKVSYLQLCTDIILVGCVVLANDLPMRILPVLDPVGVTWISVTDSRARAHLC